MPFIFWAGLVFLLGSALCVHFDVFGFRRKLTRKFLSVFNFVLPNTDPRGRRMKFGMAKTASYIFAVILFLLLASIFLSFGMPYAAGDEENKYTGPLGDLFNGILTPVLTFLTFCGLLVTILIQNIQMRATLQELELTRNEMVLSNQVLQEQLISAQAQVRNSEAQKFDGNFYSLLGHQDKVIKDLSLKKIGGYILDAYLFEKYAVSSYANEAWVSDREGLLPLFLINYQLLKYISDMEGVVLSASDAKRYSNIVRALIPNKFLFLMMLNASDESFSDYRNLFERYQFFEHLVLNEVYYYSFKNAVKNYEIKVFGDLTRIAKYLIAKKSLITNDFIREMEDQLEDISNEIDSKHNIKEAEIIKARVNNDFQLVLPIVSSFSRKRINSRLILSSSEAFSKYLDRDFYYFMKVSDDISKEYINFISKYSIYAASIIKYNSIEL